MAKRVQTEPALVFVHHFGGSARTWDLVIGRLEHDHECVAFNLRGFGGEKDVPGRGTAVDDYADDVVAQVRARNIERCVLVGHSMGGKIALAVAARRLPVVAALVLVAPSPPTPEPMADDDRARLRQTHGDRAQARETVQKITAHPLPAALQERTVEDMVCSSRAAWLAWLDRGSREDVSALMANVAIPMGVLVGDRDPVVSPALLLRELVARVVQTRVTIVADRGHLLPLEAPEAVADAIRLTASACRAEPAVEGV